MDNKVYVDSEQLIAVAASIKTKSNNILAIFQGDCSQAIVLGKECLQVSGLDTTSIINSLNKIFTNLSEHINALSDFLTRNVVGEYDLTSQAIISAFNGNFATELAALLGLTVGTTVVPGATGTGAGFAGTASGTIAGTITGGSSVSGGSSGGCATGNCGTSENGMLTQNQEIQANEQGQLFLSKEEAAELESKGYTVTGGNTCGPNAERCYYNVEKNGAILTADGANKELGISIETKTLNTGSVKQIENINESIKNAMNKLGYKYNEKTGEYISIESGKAIRDTSGIMDLGSVEVNKIINGDQETISDRLSQLKQNETISIKSAMEKLGYMETGNGNYVTEDGYVVERGKLTGLLSTADLKEIENGQNLIAHKSELLSANSNGFDKVSGGGDNGIGAKATTTIKSSNTSLGTNYSSSSGGSSDGSSSSIQKDTTNYSDAVSNRNSVISSTASNSNSAASAAARQQAAAKQQAAYNQMQQAKASAAANHRAATSYVGSKVASGSSNWGTGR